MCAGSQRAPPHPQPSLQVVRFAKVPYLCRGDSHRAYYTLADALLVLKPSAVVPPPGGSEIAVAVMSGGAQAAADVHTFAEWPPLDAPTAAAFGGPLKRGAGAVATGTASSGRRHDSTDSTD